MRKIMVVLATAAALTGAMSAASASTRGAPIGPLGQVFDGVNPVDHPKIFGGATNGYGYNAYGYVGAPHARPHTSYAGPRLPIR
jgi:hypothetical protein